MTADIELALQRELSSLHRRNGYAAVHRYVLAYGRAFVGIPRPKGFRRQRARKRCYMNATRISWATGATYVEGFAMRANMPLFHHAWVTMDGVHAIDQTLPDAEQYEYFGIPFPPHILAEAINARGYFGVLDPIDPGLLRLAEPVGGNPVATFL
jgi:hypothetical protein